MSPYQVARELDDDPELLSLHCMTLLQYAETKSIFDSANKGMIESARKSSPRMAELVEGNMFAIRAEVSDEEDE